MGLVEVVEFDERMGLGVGEGVGNFIDRLQRVGVPNRVELEVQKSASSSKASGALSWVSSRRFP